MLIKITDRMQINPGEVEAVGCNLDDKTIEIVTKSGYTYPIPIHLLEGDSLEQKVDILAARFINLS